MTKQAILALSALALAACGQPSTNQTAEAPPDTQTAAPQTQTMTDAEFLQLAANSDAFEVQSSELAAERAARQEVKNFAAMMVRDHTQTTQQLAALAPQLNLPAPTPQLDAAKQDRLNDLRGLNGEAFDDAYLDAQVAAHQEAIAAFERYVASSQTGPLRDWANQTLPNLRAHLTQVQSLENAT